MAILPTSNTSLTLSTSSSDKSLQLFVGQTLMASIKNVTGNQATIQIAGQTLQATLTKDIPDAKQFQVRVSQIKPEVVLSYTSQKSQAVNASTEQLLQQTFKQLLPNQIGISQGISQLIQLTQPGNLPSALQSYLLKIFDSFFKISSRTSVEDFKSALLASGVFLEGKLLQDKKPTANDFKASLLKLLQLSQSEQAEQPQIKALIKTISQLLNKVTLQQLNSIENPNQLHLDIPIAPDKELIELNLDIRKASTPTNQPIWETIITLNLEQGIFISKCVLQNEEYSFQFWAETHKLQHQLENQLDRFRQQLDDSGLKVKHLLISKQKPQINQQATKVALIDITI